MSDVIDYSKLKSKISNMLKEIDTDSDSIDVTSIANVGKLRALGELLLWIDEHKESI